MKNINHSYDIFITHSWRFHEPWNRICHALDSIHALKWRNFSVPWYDPALDPNTPFGKERVSETLLAQILPVEIVFFLSDVYAIKSTKKWIDLELEIAKENSIPVVAVQDTQKDDRERLPEFDFAAETNYDPKALYQTILGISGK